METKKTKLLRRVDIDLKQKRAVKYAAYLTSFSKSKISKGVRKCNLNAGLLNSCPDDKLIKCCSGKAIVNNYANFNKSSLPVRVMYFSKGEWVDFPSSLLEPVKDLFRNQKTVSEVSVFKRLYMFDFLRMIQIDLESGAQQSIAWIDDNNNCFFPKFCFDERHVSEEYEAEELGKVKQVLSNGQVAENLKEFLQFKTNDEIKKEDYDGSLENQYLSQALENPSQTKENTKASGDMQSSECSGLDDNSGSQGDCGFLDQPSLVCDVSSHEHAFGELKDRLTQLSKLHPEYATVSNKFLAGLGASRKNASVVGIYRCGNSMENAQDRLKSFEATIEITRKFRGNANLRLAWHGTSKKGVSAIVCHGFGFSNIATDNVAYGNGIYLAPEDCSFVSGAYTDVDENGEQHVLLCRVILGNMEEVKPGSRQYCPNSESHDTGVDNISNPMHYVIWSSHMNTHIQPEYLVTFKVKSQVREQWAQWRKKLCLQTLSKCDKSSMTNDNAQPISEVVLASSEKSQEALLKIRSEGEIGRGEMPLSSLTCQPSLLKNGKTDVPERRRECIRVPTSEWITLPKLLSAIEKFLPKSSMDFLRDRYSIFKKGKMSRNDFIGILRGKTGDDLLRDMIKSMRSQLQKQKMTASTNGYSLEKGVTVSPELPTGNYSSCITRFLLLTWNGGEAAHKISMVVLLRYCSCQFLKQKETMYLLLWKGCHSH